MLVCFQIPLNITVLLPTFWGGTSGSTITFRRLCCLRAFLSTDFMLSSEVGTPFANCSVFLLVPWRGEPALPSGFIRSLSFEMREERGF